MEIKVLEGKDYLRAEYVTNVAFHIDAFGDRSLEAVHDEWQRDRADGEPPKERIGALDETGEVVAQMQCNPFRSYVYGRPLDMEGIGGVATLPQARRGGAIRRIFELTFERMYDRGTPLSTLYPFSARFYRKFGYESFLARVDWTLELYDLKLRPAAPDGRWQMAEPVDEDAEGEAAERLRRRLGDYITVSEAFESRYMLGTRRPRAMWKDKILSESWRRGRHFPVIFYTADGTPEAAMYYRYDEDDMSVIEVKHLAYRSGAGLAAILYYLRALSTEAETAKLRLPASVSLDLLVTEHGQTRAVREKEAMLTVVHAEHFLRHVLEAGVPGLDTASPLSIALHDPQCPKNTGIYRIEGGKLTVERLRDATADALEAHDAHVACAARLTTGPAALGLLFMGLETADMLETAGLMRMSPDAAERLADIRPQAAYLLDFF